MNTRLLRFAIASFLAVIANNSFSQENKNNSSYYYNIFDNNSIGTFTSTSAAFAVSSAGSNNLNLSGGSGRCITTTGNSTAGTLYNSYIPLNTDMTTNDWEWSILYKNTGGNPDDSQVIDNGENSWRYWIMADGTSSTTAKGYYLTQIGNVLYLRYKYDNSASFPGHFNAMIQYTLPSNNTTYNIKIQRLKGGLFKMYVDPYVPATQEAKTLVGSNSPGGQTTYQYSMLETSATSANRFLFDDIKMYTMQFQFIAYNAGLTPSPAYAGEAGVIVYALQIKMRGNFEFQQFGVTESSSASNFFNSENLYKSSDVTFTPTVPAPDTLKATSNGSGYFANINDVYQSSGSSTDGSLTTVGYYYIAGTVKSTAGSGSIQYTGVSQITTKDNNSAPAYTGFSPSGSSSGTVIGFGNTWTGSANSYWQNGSNWSSGSYPSANNGTEYVYIPSGVPNYPSSQYSQYDMNEGAGQTIWLKSLTVASGASLNIVKSYSLTVESSLVINGTLNFTSAASGNFPYLNTDGNNTVTITSGATTLVNNLTLNKSAKTNTVTLASGNATLNVTGTITANTGTLASNSNLTLISTATTTANVAQITTANAQITGTVTVQRYITGGSASYRGYRLLSSPVCGPSSTAYYNLGFLSGSGTYLTGAAGGVGTGGFDVAGNPTIYLYREDVAASSTSFTTGNYRYVNKINNATSYSIGTVDGTFSLPVGTGYLFFFRGNNSTTVSATPSAITFAMSGTLNQGQITYKNWFNYGATNLSYLNTVAAAKGFALAGNPYPSSIDWNTHYGNGTSTSKIYAPNVGHSIYVYNTTTKNYSIWTSTSSSAGSASGSPGGSNIIPSGQGFFVQATTGAAQLIFNEDAKITSQPTTLLLDAYQPADIDRHLRLQLEKDSINRDETVILFNKTASAAFSQNEDAVYLRGAGQTTLFNTSPDNYALALNQQAFPKTSQTIPLYVSVNSDGLYKLKMTEVSNIPKLYDVWLMDAYRKDSLDIKHNPIYTFNLYRGDTSSYGYKRFSLVIRQNPAYAYALLGFTAAKSVTNPAQVAVKWSVANEADYTSFFVERSTDNGKTFSQIATLQGSGLGNYTIADASPATGINLYRLKQVDFDDNITYSHVVQVEYAVLSNSSIAGNISVYPNPASSQINLSIAQNDAASAGASYEIKIMNSTGMLIKQAVSSQPVWQDSVSGLPSGTYIIQVFNSTSKGMVGKTKFVKL